MKWPDSKLYVGAQHNEKMEGRGTLAWQSGAMYEGEFCADKRNGFGVMTFADKRMYVGCWKNDKMHGEGKLIAYTGKARDGKWHYGVLLKQV